MRRPRLVVTAHPSPADLSGFEIVQKPFDLDELVQRVRRRLEGPRGAWQRLAGRSGVRAPAAPATTAAATVPVRSS